MPGTWTVRGEAEPPVVAGAPLASARVAAVLVHGRGQDPGYLLEHLVTPLDLADVAYVLPAAPGNTWYPDRFNAPRFVNEPWLGRALAACAAALERTGLPPERVVLAGFSQGACLVADFVAGAPAPYRGVALLTGALIGPDEDVTPTARLDGVPIRLVTSRHDEWVPLERVESTAQAFEAAGALVTLEVTADRDHRIGAEAVAAVRSLLTDGGTTSA
jgi:phospholipase/carboxylesterase